MLAHHLLWRHIFRRAEQRARLRHSPHFRRACYSEIHHRHFAVHIQHDVLRLQVAVHHSFAVRRFERETHLLHHTYDFFIAQLPFFRDEGFEVLSLDEFHRDELDPVGLSEIENSNHVFVGYLPREDEFLLEARENLRVHGQLRPDYF